MPCTEIVTVPLVADSQIGDPDSEAAAVLGDCFDILAGTDGVQHIRFGTRVESADVLVMMIDWDTRAKHAEFMASDRYKPFLDRFAPVMAGPPTIVHADFHPPTALGAALDAPLTEFVTLFFDADPPPERLEEAVASAGRARRELVGGFVDVAAGMTYEEIEKDGLKGKALVVVVGWLDADAAKEAKGRFAASVGEARASETYHVAVMDYVG